VIHEVNLLGNRLFWKLDETSK